MLYDNTLSFEESTMLLTTLTNRTISEPHDPEMVDHEELIRRICHSIKRKTSLGVQEMNVSLENNRLVLTGYCRTFYAKQLAQHSAMSILGDVELVNQIQVI